MTGEKLASAPEARAERTLAEVLAEVGHLPEELCRRLGRAAAEALDSIHGAGRVHGSVSLDSLVLTPDHRVALRPPLPGSVGTAADDLAALGHALFELATGTAPCVEDRRSAGVLNPQLSSFFDDVLEALVWPGTRHQVNSACELETLLAEHEQSSWSRALAREVRSRTGRPLRRARVRRRTPLHGRDEQISALKERFAAAAAGEGGTVVLVGEPGIGKTRMIDEFASWLAKQDGEVHFLFGTNAPSVAPTATGSVARAFREHFEAADLDTWLNELLGERAELAPAIHALVRGDTLSPEQRKDLGGGLPVWQELIRGLAAEKPVVLCLDDVHFESSAGRTQFAEVAAAAREHRVLVVGTVEPGSADDWIDSLVQDRGVRTIALHHLTPEDVTFVLFDALGAPDLALGLSDRVRRASGGNPFFLFEVLRDLRIAGVLELDEQGTWVSAEAARDVHIADSLRGMVRKRLERIDETDLELLELAACCGFEFDPALVAMAAGLDPIEALLRFARLENRDRLVRATGPVLAFDHLEIHHALEGGLGGQRRELRHRALARALEASTGAGGKDADDLSGYLCVRLAQHFTDARLPERAVPYMNAALTYLDHANAIDSAVVLIRQVLDAENVLEDEDRVDALLRLAGFLSTRGRLEKQRAVLEEAVAIARCLDSSLPEARALNTLGNLLASLGELDASKVRLNEALELASDGGDAALRARVHGSLGSTEWALGESESARLHFGRELELCQDRGDKAGEMVANGHLGMVLASNDQPEAARATVLRFLELAREIGNRRSEAVGAGNLAIILQNQGRLAESREYLARAIALGHATGCQPAEVVCAGTLGNTLTMLGELAEALGFVDRYLSAARSVGNAQWTINALLHRSLALKHLGRLEDARSNAEEALELARHTGHRTLETSALARLAEMKRELGRYQSAARLLEDAIQHIVEAQLEAHGLNSAQLALAEIRVRSGERDRAVRGFRKVVAAVTPESDRGRLARAHLAALDALPEEELDTLRATAGTSENLLVEMEFHLQLHRATGEPEPLARAREHLDFMLAHAPEADRPAMRERVLLHREILEG